MIGLDTNVLLRLFLLDDPEQSERAHRYVSQALVEHDLVINPIVLAEFSWTLKKRFKFAKSRVIDLIDKVLSTDDIEIQNRQAAIEALAAYNVGKADFADYFLALINRELGCDTTATFDRDAIDFPAFTPVP